MNPRGVLALGVAIVGMVVWGSLAILGPLWRAKKGYYDCLQRLWARQILWTAGIRVELHDAAQLDAAGGQVVLANHQSMLDIWVLIAALPVSVRFVAKQELGRIPFLAGSMKSIGHVLIDRTNRVAATTTIREAGTRMRDQGLSLALFPEGTRSRDGTLGRFKRGAFVLAIESQMEIVPVAIDGTGRLLPPGARTPRPGTVHLKCAGRVSTAGLTAQDRDSLTRRVEAEIQRRLG